MANAIATLAINVVGRTDKFRSGMRGASNSVGRFTRSTRHAQSAVKGLLIGMGGLTTMGGISTMVGAGGITYGMVRFAGSVERLNQSMHSSLAIMGKVSAEMKAKMMDTVMDVDAVTRYSANSIAKSYYYLASAGLSVQQSIKALPAVAKFGQAGMFDLSRATSLLTDAQSALGLKVEDATKNLENMREVSDALVKANMQADASVEQFATALSVKAAAAARIYGKSMEETMAVLAVFADQGIKGAEAGTALSIVWRDLGTKAVKNEKMFKKMGIGVFDANDEMRNTIDIVRDLEKAMTDMSDFGKKKMLLDLGFSDKSVNFQQMLLGKSDEMQKYFDEQLTRKKGLTEDVAGDQMTEWMKAWNQISASLTKFGNKYVLPLVQALAWLLNRGGGTDEDIRKVAGFGFDAALAMIGQGKPKETAAQSRMTKIAEKENRVTAKQRHLNELKDEQAKAAEKAAKALEKAADALTLKLRTPKEVFADSDNRLKEMLKAGFITQGLFDRARQVSLQESFGTSLSGLNPAVMEGSQQQYIMEARERAASRRQETLKLMLQENDKQTRLLRDIETNTSDNPAALAPAGG